MTNFLKPCFLEFITFAYIFQKNAFHIFKIVQKHIFFILDIVLNEQYSFKGLNGISS